jgi:hypothetical protein
MYSNLSIFRRPALASVEREVDVGRGEAASFVAVVGEHGERVMSAEKRRVSGRRENGGFYGKKKGRRREEEGRWPSFDPRPQPISRIPFSHSFSGLTQLPCLKPSSMPKKFADAPDLSGRGSKAKAQKKASQAESKSSSRCSRATVSRCIHFRRQWLISRQAAS